MKGRPSLYARAGACFLCAALAVVPLTARGEPGLGVRFLEDEIRAIAAPQTFDIEKPVEVFAHVFAALGDEATVYPTENYHYFRFFWGGLEFAGNLRLDAADRDDGILHFAYFTVDRPWTRDRLSEYRALSATDGVAVTRREPLVYEVAFDGRTVVFHLNDLSAAEPEEGAVREGETNIGPMLDDSAIPFLFLFDEDRKQFRFVLDESRSVNDVFVPVHPDHPQLTLGMRTGFAFYRDRFAPRSILVGVSDNEVSLNTPLDGPFDQIPDNFLDGDAYRDAIIAVHPDLDGEIDRYGAFAQGEGRFLVGPYMSYRSVAELETLLRCADPALDEDAFYDCVTPGER